MNARWTLLAPAAIAILLLAGCAEPVKPFTQDSTIAYIERHKGYTWPEALVTDASGANSTLADVEASDVAFFVQQMVPREGANPSIAFSPKGTLFATTFDRLQVSKDQGRNWTMVDHLLTDGFPKRQDKWITFDAYVHVAQDPGNRVFLFHDYGCVSLWYSDDDGATFTNEQPTDPEMREYPYSCAGTQGVTGGGHIKFLTAPFASNSWPPEQQREWDRPLYMCRMWRPTNLVDPMVYCATSYDSGKTFSTVYATYDSTVPQFLNPEVNDGCFIINVGRGAADSQGNVLFPIYRVNPNTGEPCVPGVVETNDNGFSWQYRIAPAGKNRTNMDYEPQIAFAGDKEAYMVYRYAADSHVYIMRSNDRFKSNWEGPFRVSPTEQILNTHVSIIGGDSPGRIAVAYYGTRDAQERTWQGKPMPDIANLNTVWGAFVSQSFNANAGRDEMRFVTNQVNANQDPVSVGCLGQSSAYMAPGAEYLLPGASGMPGVPQDDCGVTQLSWVNLAQDKDGRPYLAFSDSCDSRNDCLHDFSSAFQSRDRMVSVAPLDFGFSMKGDKVALEKLGLNPPELARRSAQE